MNDQQPMTPHQRQKALLAIPERQRTDAQWDELNDLEISLASVNRDETRESRVPHSSSGPNQSKSNGGERGKRPVKRSHKKPLKEGLP